MDRHQATRFHRGEWCKRREKWTRHLDHRTLVLHSAVITPAVALLVNDALRWVVDQLVRSINGCARRVTVYRTVVRGDVEGERARSQQWLFFALRAVLVFRTYFCRGFCAPSSASKRATLPAPDISAARRIIILGFDLYYHWSTHPRERHVFRRDALRTCARKRGRENVSHHAVADAAHEMLLTAGVAIAIALRCCGNSGCGRTDERCHTEPLTVVSWENVSHVAFNAQVRQSSTTCHGNCSTRTFCHFEPKVFELKRKMSIKKTNETEKLGNLHKFWEKYFNRK